MTPPVVVVLTRRAPPALRLTWVPASSWLAAFVSRSVPALTLSAALVALSWAEIVLVRLVPFWLIVVKARVPFLMVALVSSCTGAVMVWEKPPRSIVPPRKSRLVVGSSCSLPAKARVPARLIWIVLFGPAATAPPVLAKPRVPALIVMLELATICGVADPARRNVPVPFLIRLEALTMGLSRSSRPPSCAVTVRVLLRPVPTTRGLSAAPRLVDLPPA